MERKKIKFTDVVSNLRSNFSVLVQAGLSLTAWTSLVSFKSIFLSQIMPIGKLEVKRRATKSASEVLDVVYSALVSGAGHVKHKLSP